MNEHAVRLGPWGTSVGVVCLPEGRQRLSDAPSMLFLNAGLLSHAGPHRLHVNLARRLARAGIGSLRFDLSGIGDSGSRRDRLGREEAIVRETADSMDFLHTSYGAQSFVLFGICSGADQAVRTALADERVVGAVLVDGYAYRTTGHLLRYYAGRFLRPRSWWNVLSLQHPGYRRLAARLRGQPESAPARSEGPRLGVYRKPSRELAEVRLGELVERGCQLCVVHTCSTTFNQLAQFGEMFPSLARAPQVRVEYFAHANHMFTLLANQEALLTCVESWMREAVLGRGARVP